MLSACAVFACVLLILILGALHKINTDLVNLHASVLQQYIVIMRRNLAAAKEQARPDQTKRDRVMAVSQSKGMN